MKECKEWNNVKRTFSINVIPDKPLVCTYKNRSVDYSIVAKPLIG